MRKMSLENKYNLKSPGNVYRISYFCMFLCLLLIKGVKRLMREARELAEPTDEYFAHPLEDNLFEWHFTVRGPPNTEFEGGFYHGRILLPSQYPMQPPNIILLTVSFTENIESMNFSYCLQPNGRFEVNKKICLSISGHHPESWQPSWSIRTALLALIAFMPTPAGGTIGSLDYTPEERQILAKKSKNWQCEICGKIADNLSSKSKSNLTQEEENLIQQIALKVIQKLFVINKYSIIVSFKAEEESNRKEHHIEKLEVIENSSEETMRQRNINSQNTEDIDAPVAEVFVQREVSFNQRTM